MSQYGLSADILTMLNTVFIQYPAIEWVKLYGSRAKGNFHNRSDIDLAVYGTQINRESIADMLLTLDDSDIPLQIDLQNYAEITNPELLDHINRVGIVMYQQADT